ncbi:interleukin-1 beta-like [Pseudophryne corroboree]|uniref:interleukin-1 beta-like n=1 Tax=Pseudophryne corroboree TaxID=495146 RepID=UPI003081C9F1
MDKTELIIFPTAIATPPTNNSITVHNTIISPVLLLCCLLLALQSKAFFPLVVKALFSSHIYLQLSPTQQPSLPAFSPADITMAEVPELNVIPMDSYSEYEEEFYADYPCDRKSSMKHLDWTSHHTSWSTSGIKPEIRKTRKPRHCFRKAIMLVVAVEKLKKKVFDKRSLFDDSDLMDHILVEDEITFNKIENTCAPPRKFLYSNTTVHIIRDCRQKCLALKKTQGRAHLVALFLQGKNLEQEAKINVGTYVSPPLVEDKYPVTLGLAGHNLFLSCIPGEDSPRTPVLSLLEVTNIQEKRDGDLLLFLFYKTENTSHNTTFESVAFPGWYISTSQQDHQFVQMKAQDNQVFLREFDVTPEGI